MIISTTCVGYRLYNNLIFYLFICLSQHSELCEMQSHCTQMCVWTEIQATSGSYISLVYKIYKYIGYTCMLLLNFKVGIVMALNIKSLKVT